MKRPRTGTKQRPGTAPVAQGPRIANDPPPDRLDPGVVRRMYLDNRYTVSEIASSLSVSRSEVTAALKTAGVEWRTNRRPCPVDSNSLRVMMNEGAGSPGMLARAFGVGHNTARRWLAEAGLLDADPAINKADLHELYVDRQLSTREVAAKLGVDKSRVLRALVTAGIPARPREEKRPRPVAGEGTHDEPAPSPWNVRRSLGPPTAPSGGTPIHTLSAPSAVERIPRKKT